MKSVQETPLLFLFVFLPICTQAQHELNINLLLSITHIHLWFYSETIILVLFLATVSSFQASGNSISVLYSLLNPEKESSREGERCQMTSRPCVPVVTDPSAPLHKHVEDLLQCDGVWRQGLLPCLLFRQPLLSLLIWSASTLNRSVPTDRSCLCLTAACLL